MNEMNDKKQTYRELGIMALGELIVLGLIYGAFALLGKLDGKVLLGGAIGAATAVLNYFLMAVGVFAAADRAEAGEPEKGKRIVSLSVDQNAVFFCPVRRADLGWQPDGSGQRWPTLENGYLAPLLTGLRPYPGSTTWSLFVNGPVAAVKADSPRTELTLVLEDWHSWEEDQRDPGGRYPLIQTLEQDGWRFYGINDSTRRTDVKPDQDPTLRRFVEWCLGVEDVRPPASLELRSYDEAGKLLQSCRLPLFPQ